jgi:hypothetical protein
MPTRFAHAQSKYGDRSFTLGDAARTAVLAASVPVLPFVALGYGIKKGAKYGKKGANMAAKGFGNITGLRTRSGLTRKQKAAATVMNSRGGRKLKKSNKRKSVKKSKGKKTTTRKRGKK